MLSAALHLVATLYIVTVTTLMIAVLVPLIP